MKRSNKTFATPFTTIVSAIGLLLLPALSEAHPGHDGVHVHLLSTLILTVAACYTLKRIFTAMSSRIQRRTTTR